MNTGSVNPLTSSVITMTLAARKMMRLRPGNGAPEAVVSGSDSAAAMVTEPRMPAQPTRNTSRGSWMPSRWRMRLDNSNGKYAPGNTHSRRSTITTTESESAYPASSNALDCDRSSIMEWSWMPSSKNTSPLNANNTIVHTSHECVRVGVSIWRVSCTPA